MSAIFRKPWLLRHCQAVVCPHGLEGYEFPKVVHLQMRKIDAPKRRVLLSDTDACIWAQLSEACMEQLQQGEEDVARLVGGILQLRKFKVRLALPDLDPNETGTWEDIAEWRFREMLGSDPEIILEVIAMDFVGGDDIQVQGNPVICSTDPMILDALRTTPLGELQERIANRQDEDIRKGRKSRSSWVPSWDLDEAAALAEDLRDAERSRSMIVHQSEPGTEIQNHDNGSDHYERAAWVSSSLEPDPIAQAQRSSSQASQRGWAEEEEEDDEEVVRGPIFVQPLGGDEAKGVVSSRKVTFAADTPSRNVVIVASQTTPHKESLTRNPFRFSQTIGAGSLTPNKTGQKIAATPSQEFPSKSSNAPVSGSKTQSSQQQRFQPVSQSKQDEISSESGSQLRLSQRTPGGSQKSQEEPGSANRVSSQRTPQSARSSQSQAVAIRSAVFPSQSPSSQDRLESVRLGHRDGESPNGGGSVHKNGTFKGDRDNDAQNNATPLKVLKQSVTPEESFQLAKAKESTPDSSKMMPRFTSSANRKPLNGTGVEKTSEHEQDVDEREAASLSQISARSRLTPHKSPSEVIANRDVSNQHVTPKSSVSVTRPSASQSSVSSRKQSVGATLSEPQSRQLSASQSSVSSRKQSVGGTPSEPQSRQLSASQSSVSSRKQSVGGTPSEPQSRRLVAETQPDDSDDDRYERLGSEIHKKRERHLGPLTQIQEEKEDEEAGEEAIADEDKDLLESLPPRKSVHATQSDEDEDSDDEEEETKGRKRVGIPLTQIDHVESQSSSPLVSSMEIESVHPAAASAALRPISTKRFTFHQRPEMSVNHKMTVNWVSETGPAARQRIKMGDSIVSVNGKRTFMEVKGLLESKVLPLVVEWRPHLQQESAPVEDRSQGETLSQRSKDQQSHTPSRSTSLAQLPTSNTKKSTPKESLGTGVRSDAVSATPSQTQADLENAHETGTRSQTHTFPASIIRRSSTAATHKAGLHVDDRFKFKWGGMVYECVVEAIDGDECIVLCNDGVRLAASAEEMALVRDGQLEGGLKSIRLASHNRSVKVELPSSSGTKSSSSAAPASSSSKRLKLSRKPLTFFDEESQRLAGVVVSLPEFRKLKALLRGRT